MWNITAHKCTNYFKQISKQKNLRIKNNYNIIVMIIIVIFNNFTNVFFFFF